MVSKLTIVIIAVVAAMAILVAIPNINKAQETDNFMEYSRQHLTKESGTLTANSTETLAIENDGSASYVRGGDMQIEFDIGGEDVKRLKALISETGFMQIPETSYKAKEGDDNYTEYSLKVQLEGKSKTIQWVDPDSYSGTIPPIIMNIGSQLDAIISKQS